MNLAKSETIGYAQVLAPFPGPIKFDGGYRESQLCGYATDSMAKPVACLLNVVQRDRCRPRYWPTLCHA